MKKDIDAARIVFKTGEGQFDSRFYFSNYLKFEIDQPGEDYETRVCSVFEQIQQSTLPETVKNDYKQSYLDFLMEFGSSAKKYNELEASLRPPPVYVVESRKRAAAAQSDGEPAHKALRPEDAPTHVGAVGQWPQPQHPPHPHAGYGYPASVRF
ncbi:hypothetical protein BGZ83_000797 [Gryganskiella cystojenkinii]|nr:hypothetical protein BGZ83_000797 [Gryganskiella cystojenkinii]